MFVREIVSELCIRLLNLAISGLGLGYGPIVSKVLYYGYSSRILAAALCQKQLKIFSSWWRSDSDLGH